jgi:hypothetical protein
MNKLTDFSNEFPCIRVHRKVGTLDTVHSLEKSAKAGAYLRIELFASGEGQLHRLAVSKS